MTEVTQSKPSNPNQSSERPQGSPLTRFWQRVRTVLGGNGDTTLRESLEDVIEQHEVEGDSLSAEERSMLQNILAFGELRVEDVMVPRADIVAVEHIASIGDLIDIFRTAGHSRLPVYRDTLDDPIGMVHIKDVMGWIAAKGMRKTRAKKSAKPPQQPARPASTVPDLSKADLSTPLSDTRIRRDVLFVPPSMPAIDLLAKMQSTRIHMAVVVDEYGGTDGLASIEDLVEEIVGEIEDEHDADDTPMITDVEGGYDADARLPIEDLEEILGFELGSEDDDEDFDTLGGLVFDMVGRVPVRGELIRHKTGIEFEVLQGDPRRLRKLRIHLSPRRPGRPQAGRDRPEKGPDKEAEKEPDQERAQHTAQDTPEPETSHETTTPQ